MPAYLNPEQFDTDDQQQVITLLWRWAKSTLRGKNPWLANFILRQMQRLCWAINWAKIGLTTGTKALRRGGVCLLSRPSKQQLVSTITGTALMLSTVSPAFAGTISVNNSGDTIINGDGCTLREAIVAANNNATYSDCTISGALGDDIVDMTAISGTISLGSDLPVITETLQLNGPGAAALTLNGNNYYGIYGSPGANSIGVDGLTITNVSGDGVYANNDAVVSNSIITGPDSGIVAFNATVTGSTVTGNGYSGVYAANQAQVTTSTLTGGNYGVYTPGDATISNSTVTGQAEDGVYAGNAATVTNSSVISGFNYGIFTYGNAIVSDSRVSGNTYDGVYGYNTTITNTVVSGGGCGVYAFPGEATVNNSHVTGNGCYGVFGYGNATVTNSSVITGNIHGIYAINGDASVSDSIVTGNTAVGVLALQNNVTITNSTVTGNSDGAVAAQGYLSITRSTVSGADLGTYAYNQTTVISSTISGADGVVSRGDAIVSSSAITGTSFNGIDSYSNVRVSDSEVRGGQYGVYSFTGYALVSGSMITGINDDGVSAGTDAIVTGSVISSSGDDGVDANTGDASVSNSTVSGVDDGVDARTNIMVTNNSVITGAEYGVYARLGNATVSHSTITGNTNGGIYAGADARVAYSTVTGGQSGVVVSNTLTLTNSTISGSGRHGVENLTGNGVTINHSTIANNTGYGIANNGGTTEVNNSIIANNGGLGTTRDISGTISTGTYNLIGNGDGAGLSHNVNGNLIGSTGALLNAQLGPLQNNGGATATHLPAFSSPAIDTGNPAFSGPPSFDQRGTGFARVLGILDMGSVEQAASGQLLWFPIMFKDAVLLPDLVITSLSATSSDVIVVIQNQGSSTVVDAFWVDVYYNLSAAPGLNQKGNLYWGLSGPNGGIPLASGQEVTLSLSSPYYAGGSPPTSGTSVYGQVDSIGPLSYGAVQESNQSNNVVGAVTAVGSSAALSPAQNAPAFNPAGLPLRGINLSPALPPAKQRDPDSDRQTRVEGRDGDRQWNGRVASLQIRKFDRHPPDRGQRHGQSKRKGNNGRRINR